MKISCYKYSLSDDPFLTFNSKTASEMISFLAEEVNWWDFPNEIWVKIGCANSLLYDPMLDIFRDWNGCRFTKIDSNRLNYYFA